MTVRYCSTKGCENQAIYSGWCWGCAHETDRGDHV